MNITVKNAKVITRHINSSANNYDWVDYSFDGDYEYASATGDEYEYADGDKKPKKTFKDRAKGFGKKVGGAAKKVGKAVKNAVQWIGKHKTRKAARKLKREKDKSGKDVFKDPVPQVVPAKINGGRDDGFSRANPDGTTTEFKAGEVAKAENGKTYASEDLKKEGKNTIENGELVKVIPAEAVKELTTTEGETIPFHKDDIIDKDAPDDSKPMSTTKKVLIGSAIVAGVGLLAFGIYRLTKNK